jgi:Rrf2 family protein
MIISQTAQYALRAVVHLSEHGSEGPLRVDDIAGALAVPRNYLSKILHVLARVGLLSSSRGPNGGFELARPPEELLLADVLEPFGALPDERRCLLGQEVCSDRDPCLAHERWKGVSAAVRDFFNRTTVAELAAESALVDIGKEGAPS